MKKPLKPAAKGAVKVGIAGVTGYAGQELLRILSAHPRVRIAYLASSGKTDPGPALRHMGPLPVKVAAFDPSQAGSACDAVFLALPHKVSMENAAAILAGGAKVFDLSADFRIKDAAVYEAAYGIPHTAKPLLKQAVYGQPELHRAGLRGASLVAVPGCYPTSAVLALAPLLKAGLVAGKIIIDSKSGVSGAGKELRGDLMFSEVNENFRAYGVFKHRHAPEIGQELALLAGRKVDFIFTPHLVPMNRGILSTVYVTLTKEMSPGALNSAFKSFYRNSPFVRVLPDSLPETKAVRGTNFCDIGTAVRGKDAIILSAIDNLVKGASGQAVQAFNAAMGFPEDEGLTGLTGAV
jgi:N-acetyl-gamma-glutamyl-phosphate reductase